MELKLLRLLYGLLFFVTPLLIVPITSELFEFNKMLFIYTIAVLSVFLFTLREIRSGGFRLKKTYFTIPLGVFLASQIISTLFSIDKHTSIIGYYGRFNGGLMSLCAFAALAIIGAAIFTKDDVYKILKLSVISSFIVMLWGLPSKLGHDLSCLLFTHHFDNSCWTDQFRPAERMFSTLGQPNWLGSYLAINFFFGLILFLYYRAHKQKRLKLAVAIYLATVFACLLFTKSRSSLVAFGASGLLLAAAISSVESIRQAVWKKRKSALIIIAAAGLLFFNEFVGFGWIKGSKSNTTTMAPNQNTAPLVVTDSLDIRKVVWKGAVELGLRYPFFGTGPETFAYSYYFVRPIEHNNTSEWDFIYNKAHNEFLNYFATTGFIGLISYLGFIGSVYLYAGKKLWRLFCEKPLSGSALQDFIFYSGMLTAFTTIHISNFFGFSTSTINLSMFLIPTFIVAYENKKSGDDKLTELTLTRRIAIGVVSAATLYSVIWLVSFHIADIKYAQSIEANAQGEYYQVVRKLQDALTLHDEHLYDDRLSSALANVALVAPFQDNDKNKPEEYIRLSESYNVKALKHSPQNVQYWKTRGKNNYLFYQSSLDVVYLDQAIAAIETAKNLAPTDPKYPYTQSLFLSLRIDEEKDKVMKQNFKDRALQNIQLAVRLKPDYIEARVLAIKLFEKYGQSGRAAELRDQLQKDYPYATAEANE